MFRDIVQEVIDRTHPCMTTVGLMGGQVLMRQGDPPDSLHLVLSGRLRAAASRGGGEQVVLGEVVRGEPIGELGVVMQQPRGATIIALRDRVLLRLAAQNLTDLLQTGPRLGLPLARKLIERMTRSNERSGPSRDISNICLLPLHAGLDVAGLARRLREALESELSRGTAAQAGPRLPVSLLDRAAAEAGLGPGGADIAPELADAYHRQLAWLDEQEARHAMQVLVADREDTAWTRLCMRHADQVLLVADADAEVAITPAERHLPAADALDAAPAASLVLLHPDDRRFRMTRADGWRGAPMSRRERSCISMSAEAGRPTGPVWRASSPGRPPVWCWPVAEPVDLPTGASCVRTRCLRGGNAEMAPFRRGGPDRPEPCPIGPLRHRLSRPRCLVACAAAVSALALTSRHLVCARSAGSLCQVLARRQECARIHEGGLISWWSSVPLPFPSPATRS